MAGKTGITGKQVKDESLTGDDILDGSVEQQDLSFKEREYKFGRSGNNSSNTWLKTSGNKLSNRSGYGLDLVNPIITEITCTSRDTETYDIQIWEHDGNLNNDVLLGTVNIVGNSTQTFAVNFAATQGKQLAARIGATFSGNVRDPGVQVIVIGDN